MANPNSTAGAGGTHMPGSEADMSAAQGGQPPQLSVQLGPLARPSQGLRSAPAQSERPGLINVVQARVMRCSQGAGLQSG